MNRKLILAALMGSSVLLAACGGSGSGHPASSDDSADSTEQTDAAAPDAQPETLTCPDGYKSFQIADSVLPNANISLVTDDNIAKLTFQTPADTSAMTGTICLGKPDPLPAGVAADYAYEIKASGAFAQLANPTLTLTFSTETTPSPNPPVVELADVSSGTPVYQPLDTDAGDSAAPNYSLAVAAGNSGLYVVRLQH